MNYPSNDLRGTGRTTEQLRTAPKGSLFVWCNWDLFYPKRLCHLLKRDDIRIEPVSVLDNPNKLRGLVFPAIIVDHATDVTSARSHNLSDIYFWCLKYDI